MQGRVIQSTGSWYEVLLDSGALINCRMKGRFRLSGQKLTNPIAVGDLVEVDTDAEEHASVITNIHPRKNYIVRSAPHKTDHTHILASNIDQCIVIASLVQPRTSTGFIDRILLTAELYGIPALVIFNKIDIYKNKELKILDGLVKVYNSINYKSIGISVFNPPDTERVKELLKNKISLLTGHSGVGKSSLINTIEPALDLKIREISQYTDKGKHTTTFSKMHVLSFGGFIIDTPGIKEFGLMDVQPEELGHFFPEIRQCMANCKFNDCQHINEKDCAVIDAVENGEIAATRYISYVSFYEDLKSNKIW